MSSLRGRTAIAFAALAAVIAIVMSVVVYRTSVDQRVGRLRALSILQARSAATIYGSTRALVGDATVNDPSAPGALRRTVASGRAASQIVSDHGSLMVWGGAPVADVRGIGLFVSQSGAEDARALRALRDTLVLTSAIVIVAGALGGTLVAASLSRRLRAAAAAARAITAGDLRARVGSGGRDEVGVLSDAVDAMAQALGSRIESERRFNADVAHELRTPVTGLLAAAALLPEQDVVSDMIRERSRRLHRLTEDLLEIARLEGGGEAPDPRRIDLRPFLVEIAARYQGVAVEGTGSRSTDPRRLERVVVNLVENALRHGKAPVTITLRPASITVTDSGAGFPVHDGQPLTARFVSRAERGYGLGLAIAYEQARVLDARLALDNAPGGGARATIRWAA